MERIFKFRAWIKKTKQWLTQDCHYLTMNGSGILGSDADKFIIQQFTGLLDKNNKEIYEGDIVKNDLSHIANNLRADENPKYTNGEIIWLCSAFKVCQSGLGATWLGNFSTCNCCSCGLEVIGNILESPELKQI